MARWCAPFLAGWLVLGSPVLCRSETITLDFSGRVASGIDLRNIFGGGDLTGKTYAVSESFDLSNPYNLADHDGAGGDDYAPYYLGFNAETATLTIGSSTLNLDDEGALYAMLTRRRTGGFDASVLNRYGPYYYEAQLFTAFDGITASGKLETTEGGFPDQDGDNIVLGPSSVAAVPLPPSGLLLGLALIVAGSVGFARRHHSARAVVRPAP